MQLMVMWPVSWGIYTTGILPHIDKGSVQCGRVDMLILRLFRLRSKHINTHLHVSPKYTSSCLTNVRSYYSIVTNVGSYVMCLLQMWNYKKASDVNPWLLKQARIVQIYINKISDRRTFSLPLSQASSGMLSYRYSRWIVTSMR